MSANLGGTKQGTTIELESTPHQSTPGPQRRRSIDGHAHPKAEKYSPRNPMLSEEGLLTDKSPDIKIDFKAEKGGQRPTDRESKAHDNLIHTLSREGTQRDMSLYGSVAEERQDSERFSQLFRALNLKNLQSSSSPTGKK